MPVPIVNATNAGTVSGNSALLVNPGDVIQIALGGTGVGNPPDSQAMISLVGVFTNAVVAIEAVPLGLPLNQAPNPPQNPGPGYAPASVNSWVGVTELSIGSGTAGSSPVGPLSSTGGYGSGYGFTVPCAMYQMMQLRLVSISSGAILGGIATGGFPASSGVSQTAQALSAVGLEIQRSRVLLNFIASEMGYTEDIASIVTSALPAGT